MGREVSNPCGTSPSHIMRVSLMKVAQYRLVSPCPKLTRERLQFPTSVCRASPRPLFNVKFSTSNKLHKLNLISLPEHTPLKHVSNINTTIIDTNVQGHILSVTIAIRDILLLKVYVNVMDIKILKQLYDDGIEEKGHLIILFSQLDMESHILVQNTW